MAETYFIQRAEDCRKLASEELDPGLIAVLHDLETDYRMKARRALAPYRSH